MVTMYAKWVGIDFGQTLMDSSPERTYWMIGDTSKELGEPELVEERCHRWREMKEKYGSYPVIKEKARPETMTYVFDDRPGVAEIFSRIEQKYLKVADGAIDAIKYLRDQGIEVSIVAELKRTLGPIGTDMVSKFLIKQGVIEYFDELISPQGKIDLRTGEADLQLQGHLQGGGRPLRRARRRPALAGDRAARTPIMVGDKQWSDISASPEAWFPGHPLFGLRLPRAVHRHLRDPASVRAQEHHPTGGVKR